MANSIKRSVRCNNSILRKSRKIISIFIVFLLLTTILTATVGSERNIFDKDSDKDDSNSDLKNKLLDRERIQEKIRTIKDRFSQLKERFSRDEEDNSVNFDRTRNTQVSPRTSFVKSLRAFIEFKDSGSLLLLSTNYKGQEKESPLRFFGTTKVDLNSDGKDDISAKISIYPYLERPLSLSLNFRLKITRLEDFPDSNALFSVYTELVFPGLIDSKQKGDKIRFGYESPDGEQVPDSCTVTYKYLPHLISSDRPEHKAKIDPGSSEGNAKLTLLLSYLNYEGETIFSEIGTKTIYNPSVESEMHIYGDGIFGGANLNFERTHSQASKVDNYIYIYQNGSSINAYSLDSPQKITFNIDLGKKGRIEFDTHGSPPSEIGICDNIDNPVNKVYFENLPSFASLKWNRNILFGNTANLSFNSDTDGIKVVGHINQKSLGTFDFSFKSEENLNCTAELNLTEGYLEVLKSDTNLSFSIDGKVKNSISFNLSFAFEKFYNSPFRIYFDKLINEDIEFTFSSKEIILYDFSMYADLNSTKIGIKADKIVKLNEGNLTLNLSIDFDGKNASFDLVFDLECEITIYGLTVGLNGQWAETKEVTFLSEGIHHIGFSLQLYDFEFYLASDFSWGYFYFRFGMEYGTYKNFTINGRPCGFKGTVYLGSGSNGLNISWYTDRSQGTNLTKLNISGLSLGLKDFHFFLGHLIDIKVSDFQGSISLVEACKDSGYGLIDFEGDQSSLDFNVFFNMSNSSAGMNLTLNIEDFHIDLEDSSAQIELYWLDGNVSRFAILANTNINLTLTDLDFRLDLNNTVALNFENMTGYVQGFAGIDIDFTFPLNIYKSNSSSYFDFSEETFAIVLKDIDVYLSIGECNLALVANTLGLGLDDPQKGWSLGEIIVSATVTGTSKIDILNLSMATHSLHWFNVSWVNISLGLDATNGNLNLNLFKLECFDQIIMAFGIGLPFKITVLIEDLSIDGYSTLTIPLGSFGNVFSLPMILGFRFENEINAYLSIDRISIIIPDLFGNLSDDPLQVYLENVALVQGTFEMQLRLMGEISLKIPKGNALHYAKIGAELPDYIDIYGVFNHEIDYLEFDYNSYWNNNSEPFAPFLLIDTHNSSFKFDVFAFIKKDLVNFIADLLNETQNITIPKIEDDIGVHLHETTLRADKFILYTNQSAFPHTEGFLFIESGEILLLANGTWVPLSTDGVSLTYYPGHLKITFALQLEDYILDINYTLPNGDKLKLNGEFTIAAPDMQVDIFWSWDEQQNLTLDRVSVAGEGYVEINDFSLTLGENISLSFNTFSINGNPEVYEVYLKYVDEEFYIGGSAGVTLLLENLNLDVVGIISGIGGVNLTVQIPQLIVTLTLDESEIMFTLIPLIITPIQSRIPVIGIGETLQLRARGAGPFPVSWVSRNNNVAEVDPTGLVTGKGRGTATIVAWCQGRRATVQITVTDEFFIRPSSINLYINDSKQLIPVNHVDPIDWSSSDSSVASVNETGLVTAHKLGKATIKAVDDEGRIAYSNITVISYTEPEIPLKTILYAKGRIDISGKAILGLYRYLEGEENSASFYGYVDGEANLSDFNLKATINPSDLYAEVIIPNRIEIVDGALYLDKKNYSSPGYLNITGKVSLEPGNSEWGYIGFGIRADTISNNANRILITLESAYFNSEMNDPHQPGGGAQSPTDPNSKISLIFDTEAGTCNIKSENDSISFSLTKLNVKFSDLVEISLDSIEWNKVGKIDIFFDYLFGILPDPQGGDDTVYGKLVRFKYYANHQTTFSLNGLYLRANLSKFFGSIGWIEFPIITWINASKFKKGYQSAELQFMSGIYFNLKLDSNATWNCTIDVGHTWGTALAGRWEFNSEVDSNWSLYVGSGLIDWDIYDSGVNRYFDISHDGPLGAHLGISVGPIQLTPGEILIEWDGSILGNIDEGALSFTSTGVCGGGDLIRLELGNSCEITLGTFEIDDGSMDILWNVNNEINSINYINLDNEAMFPSLGLIKGKIGNVELKLGEVSFSPGTTYIEWTSRNADSGHIYVNNDLDTNVPPIELSLFELLIDINIPILKIDKIGTGAKFFMEDGEFNCEWEKLSSGDYDKEYIINNGIFEAQIFDLILQLENDKNMVLSIDKRDMDISDYSNTITIKTRFRGLLNNAIFVNTSDYLKVNRTSITLYQDGWKIFELNSVFNLKFKFNEWMIGFIDGKPTHHGRIIPGLYINTDVFNFLISAIFRDSDDDLQEISLYGNVNINPTTPFNSGFTIDLSNCSDDISSDPANPPSITVGNYKLEGSYEINAYSYFTTDLEINLNDNTGSGHWNLTIDNGAQSLINDISIKVLREDKKRGIDISVSGLEADGFWVYGECEKILGIWLPVAGSMQSGGSLSFYSILIWISIGPDEDGDYNWKKIWDDGPSPLIIGGSSELEVGESVCFQASVSGGALPYYYQWTFPDGRSSSQASPSYVFSTLGNQAVILTVKDSKGTSVTVSKNYIVSESDSPFGNGPL